MYVCWNQLFGYIGWTRHIWTWLGMKYWSGSLSRNGKMNELRQWVRQLVLKRNERVMQAKRSMVDDDRYDCIGFVDCLWVSLAMVIFPMWLHTLCERRGASVRKLSVWEIEVVTDWSCYGCLLLLYRHWTQWDLNRRHGVMIGNDVWLEFMHGEIWWHIHKATVWIWPKLDDVYGDDLDDRMLWCFEW